MSIGSAIIGLEKELPPAVKLVAVSKFHPAQAVMEAYSCGQRAFGESRPQELAAKAAVLPSDIEWHFIGHLQTNKIKTVLQYASLIESVDSEHLLKEIDSCAASMGKVADCLLEIHISSEESKQGFSFEEAGELLARKDEFTNVRIRGLMGMASFTDDTGTIRREFKRLKEFYDTMPGLSPGILSMGMSSDWRLAVEEGTNLVRIGTAIFGERK